MTSTHLVQRDERVLEEGLHHNRKVLALRVLFLVGQPGDVTLRVGQAS